MVDKEFIKFLIEEIIEEIKSVKVPERVFELLEKLQSYLDAESNKKV